MGLFDLLTGRCPPAPGLARRPKADLRAALLRLSRDTSPVLVRPGAEREDGADLVAEWRLGDPRWHEVFGRAGLAKAAQLLLRLDDAAGEVRAVSRDWTVEWHAGLPLLSRTADGARGRTADLSWGRGHAFREEDLRLGKVYHWSFDTRALRRPLQEVVAASGWAWRGVAWRSPGFKTAGGMHPPRPPQPILRQDF